MRPALLALLLLAPGMALADSYFVASSSAQPQGLQPAIVQRLGAGPYFAFERENRWYVVRDPALVKRAGALSPPAPDTQKLTADLTEAAQRLHDAKTTEERARWNREVQRLEVELGRLVAPAPKLDEAAKQRAQGLRALADEALKAGLAQKVP